MEEVVVEEKRNVAHVSRESGSRTEKLAVLSSHGLVGLERPDVEHYCWREEKKAVYLPPPFVR